MTITVNFKQAPTPGYTPRKPITLHNIAAVVDKGVGAIEVHKQFTDDRPTFDHVASVTVRPETE